MGKQYIDIIWLLPILVTLGITCLVFNLGVEVGKDRQKREDKARRRHPSSQYTGYVTEYPSNVIKINRSK